MAARSAVAISLALASGITAYTAFIAASLSTPVGSPSASRTMLPPGGSGVSRVMPASSSASELASAMCPSRRLMNTGLSGVTASISWRVGRSAGVQRSWSQLPLSTQRPLSRVVGGAGDAGQFGGQGVGQRHVPVEAVDEYRIVGSDRIDQLARGQVGGRRAFVVPVGVEYPAALV